MSEDRFWTVLLRAETCEPLVDVVMLPNELKWEDCSDSDRSWAATRFWVSAPSKRAALRRAREICAAGVKGEQ